MVQLTNAPLTVKHDMDVKVVLIGQSGSGKTSLLHRLTSDAWCPDIGLTIGVDFQTAKKRVRDKLVRIRVWDTNGQTLFRNVATAYYPGAMGVVAVYDVTDRHTFEEVRHWINSLKGKAADDVNLVLVGNKCDMPNRRCVSCEEGQALADTYGAVFLEASAKDGLNVDRIFLTLCEAVMDRQAMYQPNLTSTCQYDMQHRMVVEWLAQR